MDDQFRNFKTYKIDPLTEIRNAGIVTNGEVFWVSSVSDSDHTERTDALGNTYVKEGLQAAIDETETDQNDYVLVIPTDGGTARSLGTAVDVNKDRVHVLGVGYTPPPNSYNGLTFEGYVEADGVDTELLAVTGAGVEIGGLKFLGTSGTHANGTMTALVAIGTEASGTAHDLYFHHNHVESTQAAAANGTANIIAISGDVPEGITGLNFESNWLGNWSFAPEAVINVINGTAGPTRLQARDNIFVIDAQAIGDEFVTLGTGQTEYAIFENNKFINVEAGTKPTSALLGAILVDNPVLLWNNTYVNVTEGGSNTSMLSAPTASGTAITLRDYGIATDGAVQPS